MTRISTCADGNGTSDQHQGQEDGLLPVEQMYLDAIGQIRLNPTRALTRLQAMVDLFNQPGDDTGRRGQCLTLARRRLAQLRKEVEKHVPDQLAVLREHLAAADAMRKSEPGRARAMYQAMIELYGDKPWAAEPVGRARQALEKMPRVACTAGLLGFGM